MSVRQHWQLEIRNERMSLLYLKWGGGRCFRVRCLLWSLSKSHRAVNLVRWGLSRDLGTRFPAWWYWIYFGASGNLGQHKEKSFLLLPWQTYGKVKGVNTSFWKYITKVTWHNLCDITLGGVVSIKQKVYPKNQEVRKMTCALGGF